MEGGPTWCAVMGMHGRLSAAPSPTHASTSTSGMQGALSTHVCTVPTVPVCVPRWPAQAYCLYRSGRIQEVRAGGQLLAGADTGSSRSSGQAAAPVAAAGCDKGCSVCSGSCSGSKAGSC